MTDEKFLRQELEQEACDAFDRSQSTIEMNKEIHFSIEKCSRRINKASFCMLIIVFY